MIKGKCDQGKHTFLADHMYIRSLVDCASIYCEVTKIVGAINHLSDHYKLNGHFNNTARWVMRFYSRETPTINSENKEQISNFSFGDFCVMESWPGSYMTEVNGPISPGSRAFSLNAWGHRYVIRNWHSYRCWFGTNHSQLKLYLWGMTWPSLTQSTMTEQNIFFSAEII